MSNLYKKGSYETYKGSYETYYDTELKTQFTMVEGRKRYGTFRDKIIRQDFPSLYEFLREVELPHTWKPKEYGEAFVSDKPDFNFYGTKSLSEAIDLCRSGWDEGIVKVNNLVDKIKYKLNHLLKDFSPIRSYTGSMVDIDAFIHGEPENMLEWEIGVRDKPTITIHYNISTSASVSMNTMVAKGAATLAMIDILEALGTRVYLKIGETCRGSYVGSTQFFTATFITAKEANEPLNINLLAFALAHPSMLRRLHFKLQETYPEKLARLGGVLDGYGMPVNFSDVPAPYDFGLQSDIYIPAAIGNQGQWANADTAASWVLKNLGQQGIELLD